MMPHNRVYASVENLTERMRQEKEGLIARLHAELPEPPMDNMKSKGPSGEFAGPCPFPGCTADTDGFFIREDGSFYCRKCGRHGGDKIDFYRHLHNMDVKGLAKRYGINLNKSPLRGSAPKISSLKSQPSKGEMLQPPKKETAEATGVHFPAQETWDALEEKNRGVAIGNYYFLLRDRRGLKAETIKTLHAQDKIRLVAEHRGRSAIAVAFSRLSDGKVLAVQFLSLDQESFDYCEDNKVFSKGSRAGDECFFVAGTLINETETIVLVESAINAMSGAECVPDVCWLALGGATFTKKVTALTPYVKQGKRIICFFDNDDAGYKAVKAGSSILNGVGTGKIFTVSYPPGTPEGYDPNDLHRDKGASSVKSMIDWVTPVTPSKEDSPSKEEDVVEQKRAVISYLTFADIMREPKELEWIITGFMAMHDSTLIHAPGGLGKTMLWLYIVLFLAARDSATPFSTLFGHEQFFIPKRRCTLIVQSENGWTTLYSRIKTMCVGAEWMKNGLDRIFVVSKYGDASISGESFSDPFFQEFLIAYIILEIEEKHGVKIDLLVVDPLISFHGGNENDSVETRAVLDGIDSVCKRTKCAPVVVHHSKKDSAEYRGSTAINDWARNRISLSRDWMAETVSHQDPTGATKTRQKKIPLLRVTHEKSNNFQMFDSFLLRMDKHLHFNLMSAGEAISPGDKEICSEVVKVLRDVGGRVDGNTAFAKLYQEYSGKGLSTARGNIAKALKHGTIQSVVDIEDGRPIYRYSLLETGAQIPQDTAETPPAVP